MRPAWVNAAAALALLATSCGSASSRPIVVSGTVSSGGVEMTLRQAVLQDEPLPYREGPPGSHCAVYTIEVRATDGARHDLRPADFASQGAGPADAVGRCGSAQLEPTWIGGEVQALQLTILEGEGAPGPLYWSPP
jgi:hypothetical protein